MKTTEEKIAIVRPAFDRLLESYLGFTHYHPTSIAGNYIKDALTVVIEKFVIVSERIGDELAMALAGVIGELAGYEAAGLTSPIGGPSERDMARQRVSAISQAVDWYMAQTYRGEQPPVLFRDRVVIELVDMVRMLVEDDKPVPSTG